jgi:hypothetical protein
MEAVPVRYLKGKEFVTWLAEEKNQEQASKNEHYRRQ